MDYYNYAYLAIMFLALKPYKVNWVNHTDGAISLLLAFFSLTYYGLKTEIIYIVGFVSGLSIALIGSLIMEYKCLRKFLS